MPYLMRLGRMARGAICSFMAALLCIAAIAPTSAFAQDSAGLAKWLGAAHRSASNVARDGFRHPIESLTFFGLRDDSGVVEILPGSGGKHEIAPPGSADFVLTFRNLHNWIERGEVEGALAAFHKTLKPGGILGVVDHRGRTDASQEAQMKSGYVREDYAIAIIEKAGFTLAGASEVNANPKDTKDHPEGIWTLPPIYRMKDQDRAKYQAIGESDRFTLRFVKR